MASPSGPTRSHPVLATLDEPSQTRELVQSKATIEDELGMQSGRSRIPLEATVISPLQPCVLQGNLATRLRFRSTAEGISQEPSILTTFAAWPCLIG